MGLPLPLGPSSPTIAPSSAPSSAPIALFRQADRRPGRLRERRPITRAAQVGGSGVIQHFADGSSQLSLEDLAVLAITLSDNTATNILIDAPGMDAVNRTLRDLGLRETKLQRQMIQPASEGRRSSRRRPKPLS